MPEAALQRRVIIYLRARGAYVFKVVGSPMQQKGTPDLLVCYRGRFLALELKVPGQNPTKLQRHEMGKVYMAGGEARIIRSIEDLEEALFTPQPKS